MAEEEETETETTEKVDKTTIVDAVKEVLADLGITGSKPAAEEETTETTEEPEEIETPRQQESRMRREVESAIGALHIHVGGDEKKETAPKPEKQETEPPGKRPWLQRIVGLD